MMNYLELTPINFKSGWAIFGDPCYWLNDDEMFDSEDLANRPKNSGINNIAHGGGHGGAGVYVEVGVGEKRVFLEYANEENYSKYDNHGRPASYVISLNGEVPPHFSEFVDTDFSLDVDAGITYVGDMGAFENTDNMPEDLQGDWHNFTSKYFDRSGYNAMSFGFASSFDIYDYIVEAFEGLSEENKLKRMEMIKDVYPKYDDTKSFEENHQEYSAKKKSDKQKLIDAYKCYSEYYHDDKYVVGYTMDTNYGDGTYGFYTRHDENNVLTHLMVVYTLPTEFSKEDDE